MGPTRATGGEKIVDTDGDRIAGRIRYDATVAVGGDRSIRDVDEKEGADGNGTMSIFTQYREQKVVRTLMH